MRLLKPEQLAEIREFIDSCRQMGATGLAYNGLLQLSDHITALEDEKVELAERAKLWRESATEWQGDYLKVKQTINALLALPKNGLSIEAQELLSKQGPE